MDWVHELVAYLDYPVCGRKNRQGCRRANPPLAGRTACRHHGGETPRGPAGPHRRHGRSSVFAERLHERSRSIFTTLVTDPELLAMNNEIALIDLRLLELVDALYGEEAAHPWTAAGAATAADTVAELRRLRDAAGPAEPERLMNLLTELVGRLDDDDDYREEWRELRTLADLRRRLVDTEGKRLERMQLFITAEEARAHNAMLVGILERRSREVLPPELRAAFLTAVVEDLARLDGVTVRRALPPGD
jgi:hypothetical protein